MNSFNFEIFLIGISTLMNFVASTLDPDLIRNAVISILNLLLHHLTDFFT
jgi:hypothetical protein